MNRLMTLSLLLLAPATMSQSVEWTEQAAEHLLNRAGFGGTTAEVQALHGMGLEGAVASLLNGHSTPEHQQLPPFKPDLLGKPNRRALMGELRKQGMDQEAMREHLKMKSREYRRADRRQMDAVREWWIERMVATPAPLQEKMVLFWHGHFTSGYRDVRNSYHLLNQNELFREHALGNFRLLLHEVTRDPAMLEYLDNDENRKGKPNENYAREVMELFTLGVGNYTEQDIKEAARAFTGWTFRGNRFVVSKRQHDDGMKSLFGTTGRLDGQDVLDLLLQQEAAPRHVASRILRFFMGTDPSPKMVQRYGDLLLRNNWEVRPLLATLFKDPAFYDPVVMGGHILSPTEFLIGICRRMKINPPARFLAMASRQLGQDLFQPPNVKGWEGELAWITTSSFLSRGNMAGYLVEGIDRRKLLRDFAPPPMSEDAEAEMMSEAEPEMEEDPADPNMTDRRPNSRNRRRNNRSAQKTIGRGFARLASLSWRPRTHLSHLVRDARTTEEVVSILSDEFLAVRITDASLKSLTMILTEYVEADSLEVYERPSEARLRQLLHLILSLPEAQLG